MYLVSLLANAAPAVDSTRAALESRASTSFLWLLISSGVVALGCIAEMGETWPRFVRWYCRKNDLPFKEENPLSWLIPLGAIGLVFVIIGVIGEAVSEGVLSVEETNLRAYDEQKLSDTIRLAGIAKDSAITAQTASGQAVTDAGNAECTANDAAKTAGNATEAAKDANKKLRSVQQQTTQLQHGLTLRQDRTETLLTGLPTLKKALEPFPGQKIDIRYPGSSSNPLVPCDNETFNFAEELSFWLAQYGWVTPYSLRGPPSDHGSGVFVIVSFRASQKTREAATSLAMALVSIPIEVRKSLRGRGVYEGSFVGIQEYPPRLPQEILPLFLPFDDDTIVLEVDPHP